MDSIGDVLSQQSKQTAALGRYEGHGPIGPEHKLNKLKQLLAQIRQMLNKLPPQLAAMLGSILAEAEAICAAGGPPEAIAGMIAKLEKLIEILMQLMMELTGSDGTIDPAILMAFLQGLAANLSAAKKEMLAKLLMALRKAATNGSLKGIDESSFDSDLGDGSKPVEPNMENALASLIALINASFKESSIANK